ncbi:histone-like nucleoid-structuring protein Lsr2 [Motilibacter aurantiacus]|uniref:histone-like nucleoid-structuring protein Lsr2 n=1 Tax=Motilibacter aurantiacus TaxID=2714955 RepID=UPI00140D7E67|nr:Lsr2 family protein [Motilibacter aurantiacus]NHC46749.1 Lsr2 family protein [Motilibacter aurantiacus]
MVQRVEVVLEDDLEGGEATETVQFGLDGASYEMDLNEENAAALREALDAYASNARRTGGGRRRAAAAKTSPDASAARRKASTSSADYDPRAVRAWAAENGVEVSARGRIPASALALFQEAGN